MDVHAPYLPEIRYLSQFSGKLINYRQMEKLYGKVCKNSQKLTQGEVKMLINLYDADIKYTDMALGSLLNRLENQMDNTIVILTADHGDEFGEHGRFGHKAVYDGLLHVPLIITGPSIPPDISIKQQVSLIDLTPTILDIVGIDNPRSFRGKSLLPLIEGREMTVAGTVSTIMNPGLGQRSSAYRVPEWKYICTERLDDGCLVGEEVYNLVDDPGEMVNLHKQDNDEANRFELEARKKIAQFKHLKAEGKTDYEKAVVKAKMKSLKKTGRI